MDAKLNANQRFEIWIDKKERIASMHEVQEYQHLIISREEASLFRRLTAFNKSISPTEGRLACRNKT